MHLLKYVAVAMVVGYGMQPSTSHAYGRQYYGGWSYHGSSSYYYRPYYYKPYPTYSGYKHNYVIYYPKSPQYYYYYSPYSRQYWGRCPVNTKGAALYSFLTPDKRPEPAVPGDKPPEADFPKATKPPVIPQTPEEKEKDPNPPELDLPPDDTPPKVGGVPAALGKEEAKKAPQDAKKE